MTPFALWAPASLAIPAGGYFRCVQDHFEQLEMLLQDRYEPRYGFWRSYVTDIENLFSWRHSGFNVYCGPTIWPHNDQGLEGLALYIICACFSQERMTYLPAKETLDGQANVIYRSKDGRAAKTFEALDWLAQLVTHIPNKGEQMVRYCGYYWTQ